MHELIRTTDPVMLSFVEAILSGEGIECAILDRNMSILEGSIGILPCRVLVDAADLYRARRLLTEADLSQWLTPEDRSR
jgi:hypothetical protein